MGYAVRPDIFLHDLSAHIISFQASHLWQLIQLINDKVFGSMLMEMLCREVDKNKLDAFVLSPPPTGKRLYTRFRLRAIGIVETEQGTFTSMLRDSS